MGEWEGDSIPARLDRNLSLLGQCLDLDRAPHGLCQIVADRDYAQLVAGEDRYGHFETVPRPAADGDAEAMAAWKRITDDQAAAYFAGVEAEKQSWTGGNAVSKPA